MHVYLSHKTDTIKLEFEKLVSELKQSITNLETFYEPLHQRFTPEGHSRIYTLVEKLKRISDPQNAVILVEFPELLCLIAALIGLIETLIELYKRGSYVLIVTQSDHVVMLLNTALKRHYRTSGTHTRSIHPDELKVCMEHETDVCVELHIDPDTGEIPYSYWDGIILIDIEEDMLWDDEK